MKYWIFLILTILVISSCTSDSATSSKEVSISDAISTEKNNLSETKKTTSTKNKKSTLHKKKPTRLGTAPARLHLQEKIEKMHENLMYQMESKTGINPNDVAKYQKEGVLYMSVYGDSLAAEYVFNAADLYRGIGEYKKAIESWYIVYKAYDRDEHPKAPHAMFQCAFTYDGMLHRKDLAKTMYTKFLKRYPNHPLAKDAKLLLKNIDKTPEELIKSFQKKLND